MSERNLGAISKMPNRPISASGLERNPQNIYIYSSGYDPAPSLISNYFSIFEMASNQRGPPHNLWRQKVEDHQPVPQCR